jgi:hypothetical protein
MQCRLLGHWGLARPLSESSFFYFPELALEINVLTGAAWHLTRRSTRTIFSTPRDVAEASIATPRMSFRNVESAR